MFRLLDAKVASIFMMPIVLDVVTSLGDNFLIASTRWNTFNRYSQWICCFTPQKLGIYGAVAKCLSFCLIIAKIAPAIQEQSFICSQCGSTSRQMGAGKGPHSASLRCGECGKFIKWISASEVAQFNNGGQR